MRIVVDLQSVQTASRLRGIGRYSLSLLKAIARNAKGHDILVALNANFPDEIGRVRAGLHGLVEQDRIRVFDVPLSLESGDWERAASNMIREAFLDGLEPDVVLVSSLFEGFNDIAATSIGAIPTRHRTACIVYDLIPLFFADRYLREDDQRRFYEEKLDWLKKADGLLAISESSRRECIEHLGYPETRITNISGAIEPDFANAAPGEAEQAQVLEQLGIDREIVLYVPGGFDDRKNFERLVEAYSGLGEEIRRGHQLVITSQFDERERFKLLRVQKRCGLDPHELVLTNYIGDEALVTLYTRAALFVFPSLHEGFGLPILEAMACGTPVIGSDRSSIPEVIGQPSALFDPCSVESIGSKMREALENESFRAELTRHASRQAHSFSWDRTARRALDALERLAQEPGPTECRVPARAALPAALAAVPGRPPSEKELLRAARSIAFNSGLTGKRQLLLDVSSIVTSDGKTGIQRVVRGLLNELLSAQPDGLVVQPVYFDRGGFRYANSFVSRLVENWPRAEDEPADLFQDDIYLSLDLTLHLPEMFPVHRQMRLLGIEVVFIVYDLLLIQRPDWWPEGMAVMFNRWLSHACETADRLICISEAVANEVRAWIAEHGAPRPGNLPKVSSFKLGADIANSIPSRGMPGDAREVLARLAASPSFLMVGTIEPRKGYAQALEAFEALWADGLNVNLVIVGRAGWLVDDLVSRLQRHRERGKRLFWLQGISDEYLEAVYASSTCLLAASEGEGFGLPLIEAAQHGLPIIARDLPVFREVAEESATYFSSEEANDLSALIADWLVLYESDRHPHSSALDRRTWADSADSLLRSLLAHEAIAVENGA